MFSLWQGLLKGFDQTINVILENSHERVYSSASGVEQVALGLYIIRGDNMSVVTLIGRCDNALKAYNVCVCVELLLVR